MASLPSSPSSSSSSSSSSSFTCPWKYDVFLSLYGKDTRKSFTDHLYVALRGKGINTFKDEPDLERGKPIDEILMAIQASRFSIVVFSPNFAFSAWCLEELATIVKCVEQGKHQVFPIFYHVDPSDIQEVTGRYGDAFGKLEDEFRDDIDKVTRWREAMKQVASVSGWDLKNKRESKFIQVIVKEISKRLARTRRFSIDYKDLVGMKSRLEEMTSCLAIGKSRKVRFIGIWGMGGIGKSTIAKVVYMNFAHQFDGSSFVENIGVVERNLGTIAHLQEHLVCDILKEGDQSSSVRNAFEREEEIKTRLSRKRVLVVLDNANDLSQLNLLAGDRDRFAKGSRIIITTRDKHLLDCFGVDEVYKVKGLNHDEALELFYKKAFPRDSPSEDYMKLSHQFVKYANRLPLALTVLGSSMCKRPINVWKETLEKLKQIPNKKISDNLEIGLDELDRNEKSIFLDIACFFVGEKVDYVSEVLRNCGFYPDSGISVLIDKNLVTLSKDVLWMHDLVQETGQEIVMRESYVDPGKRSRLWRYEDIYDVVMQNTGSGKIEGIVVDGRRHGELQKHLSGNGLSKMRNLRLLRLKNVHFSKGIDCLWSLKYLEWHDYPFKSLPYAFQPNKLVSLHLPRSNISQIWRGIKPLVKLEVMDLSYSENLTKTPDFSGIPNLKKLNLQGCKKLYSIHPSVGGLRSLVVLNLEGCESLRMLPDSVCELKSLEILNLFGCSNVHRLPVRLAELTRLQVLERGEIGQGLQPPSAIKRFQWNFLLPWFLLFFLFCMIKSFFWKKNLAQSGTDSGWLLPYRATPDPKALVLPPMSTFCCMRKLKLWECNLTEETMPGDLSSLPVLEELFLSGTKFITLPSSVSQLSKLQVLSCLYCSKLQSLPDLPPSATGLMLNGCTSLETLPSNICRHPNIKSIFLDIHTRIHSLLDLPVNAYITFSGIVSPESLVDLDDVQPCSSFPKRFYEVFNVAIFHPYLSIAVTFPGRKIPGWFNHKGTPSSLKAVHLPPNWWKNDWVGFGICLAINPDFPPFVASSLYACRTPDQILGLNTYMLELCNTSCTGHADRLCFIFISRGDLGGELQWNSFSHFYFDPYSDVDEDSTNAEVISWGFRLVYKEDIEELIRCKDFPETTGLVVSDKRHDHCWCDSSEPDPSGDLFQFVVHV